MHDDERLRVSDRVQYPVGHVRAPLNRRRLSRPSSTDGLRYAATHRV